MHESVAIGGFFMEGVISLSGGHFNVARAHACPLLDDGRIASTLPG